MYAWKKSERWLLWPGRASSHGYDDDGAPRPTTRHSAKGKLRLYVCSGIVLLYILAAFCGNLITHYSQNSINITSTLVPPGGHLMGGGIALLGTDQLGRSVLAEIVAGARDSLLIGALTLAATIVLGVVLGMLAGYYGGLVSSVIMRIVDIQMGFPPLVLAIGLAAVLGPSITTVVISLSAVYWVTIARVVEGAGDVGQKAGLRRHDTRARGASAVFDEAVHRTGDNHAPRRRGDLATGGHHRGRSRAQLPRSRCPRQHR